MGKKKQKKKSKGSPSTHKTIPTAAAAPVDNHGKDLVDEDNNSNNNNSNNNNNNNNNNILDLTCSTHLLISSPLKEKIHRS